MYDTIYNLVINLIGQVPPELNFVYGFATIFLFIVIVLCVIMPFWIIYKVVSGD